MKGNRLKAVIVCSILALQAFGAFAQTDVISQIKETIKAGSAKELSKYLNQTVDVTIEGKVQSYSKAQAEFVFRDFFKEHPPTEVTIIHQGASKGGQNFAILQYIAGDTYRIFMKIKKVGDTQLLDDIRITKE
jgi:hypothetical protein